ncbi:hypothetical protein TNCV_2038901 [Trichonephila clavipes]|nr:hypothetical protein TNCV_2038901 [Trichonephila clavipes]
METDDDSCLTTVVRADSISTQTLDREQFGNRNMEANRHPSSVTSDLNTVHVEEMISKALKKHLSGTKFSSDGDVQTAAKNRLNDQGPG